MSVSAASSGSSDPNAFVPVFASENATTAAEAQQKSAKHLTLFGESDDSPSFWDLLDVINPLQHIPIVNEIYQDLTGDKIGVGARLAGGALFGGPIGLVASAVGCLVEEETGDTIGGHVVALFKDDDSTADTQVAQADTTTAPTPAPQATTTTAKAETEAAAQPMPVVVPDQAPPAASAPPPAPTSGGTMMFTADGMIAPAAAPVPATAPAVTPAAAPMPLSATKTGRVMPVPPRTVSTAESAPPPISVPVSTGGSRSNVPITGRDPLAGRNAPDPLAVQKAMAQQGLAPDIQHPMLAGGNAATTGSTGTGAGTDWMQAMNQALDKYQKAGNLAARGEAAQPATY